MDLRSLFETYLSNVHTLIENSGVKVGVALGSPQTTMLSKGAYGWQETDCACKRVNQMKEANRSHHRFGALLAPTLDYATKRYLHSINLGQTTFSSFLDSCYLFFSTTVDPFSLR
jgi:hypothetical protein